MSFNVLIVFFIQVFFKSLRFGACGGVELHCSENMAPDYVTNQANCLLPAELRHTRSSRMVHE